MNKFIIALLIFVLLLLSTAAVSAASISHEANAASWSSLQSSAPPSFHTPIPSGAVKSSIHLLQQPQQPSLQVTDADRPAPGKRGVACTNKKDLQTLDG